MSNDEGAGAVHQDTHSSGSGEVNTTMSLTTGFSNELADLLASSVSTEEAEAIKALPPASALLIVRRGPNIGARFLLDSDTTVAGRHPDADIFLDDVTVSRRHAEFVRQGSSFAVRDLGSLNGTFYNGERIELAPLVDGAEVQVGKFRLTFYESRAVARNIENSTEGA